MPLAVQAGWKIGCNRFSLETGASGIVVAMTQAQNSKIIAPFPAADMQVDGRTRSDRPFIYIANNLHRSIPFLMIFLPF